MDLVSLTPTSLGSDSTLEAQVEVTNTSSKPVPKLALELRTRTSRVTERAELAAWQADVSADTTGTAVATSDEQKELAPGASAVLTVSVEAEDLEYSEETYYWGTRRISLTAVSDEEPLTALRSFVVWRPEGVDATITKSVLLPVAAEDPSAPVTDPAARQESLASGHLATTRTLALRDDVDWWVDPALLDPPSMSVDPEPTEEDEPDSTMEPATIYEEDAASTEFAAALQEGAGDRTVLAMPYARADLVSLEAAGAKSLSAAASERGQAVWEEAGITPTASALRLEGPTVDGGELQAQLDAGATAAIVPSSSLASDPEAAVTPSSTALYESEDGSVLPLLAPDPVLSDEFSLLTAESDTEQIQQRLLAETATIASEYTDSPRHLLISPGPSAALDAEAAGAALDALAEAPWVEGGRTSSLLTTATEQEWTTDAQSGSSELYALGTVHDEDVHPSAPGTDGRWTHQDEAVDPERLNPEVLTGFESAWSRLDTLASVMEDDTSLEAPRRTVLSGTSERWREDPEGLRGLAEQTEAATKDLEGRIEVVPASGYNLISDSVGVPVTISNDLGTPITVHAKVESDSPLVQIGEIQSVEVPAHGQVDATVPVEAIANGTVTLTTVLITEDGQALTAPVEVPLTVNPAWENWTTLVIVIAMGLLVVVGVARARRTGASTRAPAVHGPEDPVVLSQTGRSTVDTSAAEGVWSQRAASADSAGSASERDPDPDPVPREEEAP